MRFSRNIKERCTAKVVGINWLSGLNNLKFQVTKTFNSFVCHKIVIRKTILSTVSIFATLQT